MINKKAFTLMELMIVVVLIGIIAAFAIPNYKKAIRKARERDAVSQLMAVHATNLIYKAQTNEFFQSTDADLTAINTNLGINIIANGLNYSYVSYSPTEYYALAEWKDADNGFTVKMTQDPVITNTSEDQIPQGAILNPCCYNDNNCPSLEQCPT